MNNKVYILRECYSGGDINLYLSEVRWDKFTDHLGRATTFATAKMAETVRNSLTGNWEIMPIDKKEIFLAKLKM